MRDERTMGGRLVGRLTSHLARATKAPPIAPMSGWSAPLTTVASASMSFLAVLTIIAGLAAERLADDWRRDLQGIATLRVSAPPEELDDRVARALEVVRSVRGIASARVLDDAEQRALLAPWLGEIEGLDRLPAPRLVDLSLEGAGPDAARLQARLDRDAPGAWYDDHAAWRRPLAEAASSVASLAWLATAVVALAAAAMVALAARATLAANLEIVRLIRLIGGEDAYITRAFVRRLALRGLLGGAIGTAAGVGLVQSLPAIAPGTLAGALALTQTGGPLVALAAVPLAAGSVALLTARASVRVALRRMA